MSEGFDFDLQLQPRWPESAGKGAQPVNQVALLGAPMTSTGDVEGAFYLVLGHTSPPVVLDANDVEALRSGARTLDVDVRAEVYITTARLRELWTLIGNALGEGRPGSQP